METETYDMEVRQSTKLLFVLGGPKTASSSICGLLNSCAEIFNLYETDMQNYRLNKYAKQLISAYPKLATAFNLTKDNDYFYGYRYAAQVIKDAGFSYQYFGEKIADITCGYSKCFADEKVLYCYRNLAEWIAKDSIRKIYSHDDNIAPLAVQYSKHFLESFLLNNKLHVSYEQFISGNSGLISSIEKFLGIKNESIPRNWWETVGEYKSNDPKNVVTWWSGHKSSTMKPEKSDTSIEIKSDCKFWHEINPIYEKYHKAALDRQVVDKNEVLLDIAALDVLANKYAVSISDAYDKIESVSYSAKKPNKIKKFLKKYAA